ncbi:hypothetical protein [Arthrobacter sp. NIO-1057]|uniref:hypothetical protein n=1 Tax=Arthrobacter sp. NIO-1057 TaxID=993071 RepID=UPI00071DF6AD|nr:hypothetical protein [Arthrobacter sp. NIO-1057]KSU65637.1 hypothetical protein AS038_12200 [Arthrobacter sp. NIO-1057]SCC39860.1 hypothetical protein GA0061084_2489 [Arthrobacter sp. NIO-1057]
MAEALVLVRGDWLLAEDDTEEDADDDDSVELDVSVGEPGALQLLSRSIASIPNDMSCLT